MNTRIHGKPRVVKIKSWVGWDHRFEMEEFGLNRKALANSSKPGLFRLGWQTSDELSPESA